MKDKIIEMKKIKGNANTNEKRFYFDAKLKMKCKNCGAEMEIDFNDDYLSYPEVGKGIDMWIFCNGCESEYQFPCKLKSIEVTLEYDDTRLKKC